MIEYKRGSEHVIVLLHEIYGINEHVKDTAKRFFNLGYDVICPNLLPIECPFTYEEEQQAYRYFIENIGFENGAARVKELLQPLSNNYKKVTIVGFSIGATIAWLCSEEKGVHSIIGYYGSRIRDYLYLKPTCHTTLFFAAQEKSFDVNKVAETRQCNDVQVSIFDADHGFADAHSSNFNAQASEKAWTLLQQQLN
ncbi:dienelactone hydrolase family protein [Lysinibacillus sp. 54212]|uniref:dienelactone hydrolase family protein n=1 Tax=Lysinibacillus sp. 54212 TaxID=3119829 RepID=UPI002FCC8D50